MTRTADDHIMTLRIRLHVLEDNLIPEARRTNHAWVLAHWDKSRELVS